MTAFMPEAHTLFTVVHGVERDRPVGDGAGGGGGGSETRVT